MIIKTALLTIHLSAVHSLKEKRGILNSVLNRIRNKFNVAIAEVGSQDLWQKAEVGMAVVSTSTSHAHQQVDQIIRFIEAEPRLEIVAVETELL